MLENRKNEITLIYNGKDLDDKQAVSYLKSVAGEKLKTIDISKERITQSQIARIAKDMKVEPKVLIDKKHQQTLSEIDHKDWDEESVLKLLAEQPHLLRTPITKWNGKTEYWDTAYDMIKYELNYR